MKVNMPAGRDFHRMDERVGEQCRVAGEPIGEIVGHVNTGMNKYLTVEVTNGEALDRIVEHFDLYARHPR